MRLTNAYRQEFGLLGERLTHSFSPLIHAELGDYEYRLYEKRLEDVENFLRNGNFDGLNVTIPYKQTVVPFCDELSKTAQIIGSVNTVIRREDGSLYGDNTDFFGFAYLMKKAGVHPVSGKVIVLGSGGSSLTVQAVLKSMNVGQMIVISRNGFDNYENINKHSDAVLIVNTTPVGMFPDNGLSPISDFGIFKDCRAVIDLIYNPMRTELLLQAEERGVFTLNGLAMLVAQAKKAAEIFTRTYIDDDRIDAIVSSLMRITRNIILIGMPGSGKTTVGAALAQSMNREFADTDEWVINAANKSIPTIFAEDGEEKFRALETDAHKALCKRSGIIIATGGGTVKRSENLRIIRQNGIIIYLDRDLSQLQIFGRPLSERDGIEALAAARLPLYSEWCDYAIRVRSVEETVEDIKNIL